MGSTANPSIPLALRGSAQRFANSARRESKDRVFQFFSFDIRNSTAYKAARKDWPILVEKFYELTYDRLSKDDSSFRFWKLVGDELLAFREVRSRGDASSAMELAHRVLWSIADTLHKSFPGAQEERLSVKGTSWLAVCSQFRGEELSKVADEFRSHTNIFTQKPFGPQGAPTSDFLGPHIDSGFRIAKHSAPGIFALSLELAYVLCVHDEVQAGSHNSCRIVGFEPLKGIWRDRPYPIIWFRPAGASTDLIRHFSYDDKIDFGEFIKRYNEKNSWGLLKSDGSLTSTLKAIAKDVGSLSVLDRIDEMLDASDASGIAGDEPAEVLDLRPQKPAIEVHCVAICFRKDLRCLVAKRLETRSLLPNTWEFGCARLGPDQDFIDSMRVHYKDVFGLNLEFPEGPPIARYFISDKSTPGLIFAACVQESSIDDAKLLDGSKHSDVRWVTLDEAEELARHEDVVDKFAVNIRLALQKIKDEGPAA